MFKKAIIYYPKDENILKQIHKGITAFQCDVAVKYINTLKLSDSQIENLFNSLAEEIAAKRHTSA